MVCRQLAQCVVAGAVLSSLASAVQAADLSPGPYIKGFAGYSDIEVDVDDGQGGASRFDADGSAFGGALGYLAPWGAGAVGVELNAYADDANSRADVLLRDPESGESTQGSLALQGDYGYGIKLLLGGFIARKVLVYGFGGWQWYRTEATVERPDGSFTRDSEQFEGGRGGIGAAVPLYGQAWSMQVEYSRSFYGKESFSEPTQDLFTVGVAYSY